MNGRKRISRRTVHELFAGRSDCLQHYENLNVAMNHYTSIIKKSYLTTYFYEHLICIRHCLQSHEKVIRCDNTNEESYSENGGRDEEQECPSSPVSSYNNAGFTLQDFGEKLPELPPLLQQMPLNQPSSSKNFQQALHKPLPANLNHLYVKRDGNNQPVVALSSSQRFRTKFVTTVLYKPFKKVRK
ncbi:putative association with the SNF1 complex (ASC) domain, ASC domain superfamily [Helianthus anomalus]